MLNFAYCRVIETHSSIHASPDPKGLLRRDAQEQRSTIVHMREHQSCDQHSPNVQRKKIPTPLQARQSRKDAGNDQRNMASPGELAIQGDSKQLQPVDHQDRISFDDRRRYIASSELRYISRSSQPYSLGLVWINYQVRVRRSRRKPIQVLRQQSR
ncbi:hypothetical protein TKK_0015360 [Trichogramma kaykai]